MVLHDSDATVYERKKRGNLWSPYGIERPYMINFIHHKW